jgi:nucleoside-diphosphate-sugar epimerase
MIFILGGNGFVGSGLVRYCIANRILHQVITRDNYKNFIGECCDVLINANGNSKMYLAREKPLEDFDASVRSVRASLCDFHADYYVYLSSCDVYPDYSSPNTTKEELKIDVSQQRPYGFHKYLAEECVKHQAKEWLILRLGGLIGPHMIKNPIFDIINNQPLWLDPSSEMQFIHTDAAAKITFDLLNKKTVSSIINVCGEGIITLSEVIDTLNSSVSIREGSPQVRYNVSTQKLKEILSIPATRPVVLDFVKSMMQFK